MQSDESKEIKTIVFDVDGTLYRRGPVQREVGLRLLAECWHSPLRLRRIVRSIGAYRRALEMLRQVNTEKQVTSLPKTLRDRQLELAESICGYSADEIDSTIAHWLETAPLKYLRAHRRVGLERFLRDCQSRGICLAVYSDYGAEAKLEALGIRSYFSLIRSSQDLDIGTPKPSPEGLVLIMRALGSTPRESIYVGDRVGVDDQAAFASGMGFVLMGKAKLVSSRAVGVRTEQASKRWLACGDYVDLLQYGIFDKGL